MSARHEGPCTHLPLGYERLVESARAVIDAIRYDPLTEVFVFDADLSTFRDDLDVMTDAAERELAARKAAAAAQAATISCPTCREQLGAQGAAT